MGYALACHLLNDYDTALQVLSTCRASEGDPNTQPNKPDAAASEVIDLFSRKIEIILFTRFQDEML